MISKLLSKSLVVLITITILISFSLSSCSPTPNSVPDKTVSGGILGAGWGAGTGAIIGHQLSYAGEGAGIGAGVGLLAGVASGIAYDSVEGTLHEQHQKLEALQLQNALNTAELSSLQEKLDVPPPSLRGTQSIYKVFFDSDVTNLKAGSIQELEIIANSIKSDPYVKKIQINGHSDDAGKPEYNNQLAEARARTVLSYLSQQGVALDVMKIESFGATRPLASNGSPEGRQLNRRVEVVVGRW